MKLASNRQNGIALFQVLLMSVILTILLMLTVNHANQSVLQATALQESVTQRFALYSAANYAKAELLSQKWLGIESGETKHGWNFYGGEFLLELPEQIAFAPLQYKVRVQIQDMEGLINTKEPPEFLEQLLQALGSSALTAQQMREELIATQKWLADAPFAQSFIQSPLQPQNINRFNLKIQHPYELRFVHGWSAENAEMLAPYTALYGHIHNPAQTPDPLLAFLLSPSQATIIQNWRKNGEFDLIRFSELTDIWPDEMLDLYPGHYLRLTLVELGNKYQLQEDLQIQTYEPDPLVRFSQSWQH